MTLINLGEIPGDGTGDGRRYAGQKINALLPLIVKSVSVTTPPSSPQENDRYIIPVGATGDWANRTDEVAAWQPVVWQNDTWNHNGGWLFITPEEGLAASHTNGSVVYKFLNGAWVVYDPQDAVDAAEAARDAAIAASETLAWGYTFDSGVADADPGTGKFRFDNTTLMSAGFIYLSQLADEGDISSVINSWDDSTSNIKATIQIRDPITKSNWAEINVIGNVVDDNGYWKIPISTIAVGGTLSNGSSVLLGVARHGDAGSGAVDSFNGRIGVIQPANGDYGSDQIANESNVTGSTVSEALEDLNSNKADTLYALPVGTLLSWPTAVLPSGFLERDGAAISRTTYSDLFAVIGTNYGSGDGSTTFNLPDDRGLFERAWDHGAGIDPDASSRTDRGDGATGDNVGTLQADELKSHDHDLNQSYNGSGGYSGTNMQRGRSSGATNSISNAPIEFEGGNETRPINRAYMPIIKY